MFSMVKAHFSYYLEMVAGRLILIPSFLGFLLLFSSVLYTKASQRRRTSSFKAKRLSRLPLPPGPKLIPLLCNSSQLPKAKQWETCAKWANQYGQGLTDPKLKKQMLISTL